MAAFSCHTRTHTSTHVMTQSHGATRITYKYYKTDTLQGLVRYAEPEPGQVLRQRSMCSALACGTSHLWPSCGALVRDW